MKSNARENENRKEGERLSVAGTRTTKKGKFKSEIYGRVRGACFRDYGTCRLYSVGWKGTKKKKKGVRHHQMRDCSGTFSSLSHKITGWPTRS